MRSKVLIVFIHLTAWLVFFSIPLIFISPFPFDGPDDERIKHVMFLKFVTSNILLMTIFYINSHLLIPKLLLRKNYLTYAGTLLILFFAFMLYGSFFLQPPPREIHHSRHFFHPEQLNAIYLFIMVVFISGAIRIVQEWLNMEKQHRILEAERLQNELSFLHAQINPHFLFNTLNSIYGLALTRSENTADAVMQMSGLMRYILQDVGKDKVSLADEIQAIRDYVDLQKIRLSENVDINLIITGDPANLQIPPLILLGYVENAFKYGTSSHEKTRIDTEVEITGELLEFKTTNAIFRGRMNEGSCGIGVRNSERRLVLMYPGKHKLTIKDTGEYYFLHLTIHLT